MESASSSNSSSLFDRVRALLPETSNTHVKSLIEEGRIEVDGIVVRKKERMVSLEARIKILPKKKRGAGNVPILYEDRDLVIVLKREGLLTVKTDFTSDDNLFEYMKMTYGAKVKVVHRLDQGTSGILVFALSELAYDKLKDLFFTHTIERKYLAVLEGSLELTPIELRHFLYEDAAYHVHVASDPAKGKEAITHLRPLETKKGYTLVECRLETGRKNQIRAQTAEIGYPIAGDIKYGATGDPLGRLGLHAYFLAFVHPRTGKRMQFFAPPPSAFCRLFPALKNFKDHYG